MSKRIMVIDDDSEMISILKDILEQEPLSVTTFIDPIEALGEVKKTSYDLYLIDLHLPKVNGITLIKMIKELQKTARFIIITGYGDKQNVIDAFKGGVSDFILKPFTPKEITKCVNKQLEEKEMLEQKLNKWEEILETKGITDFNTVLRALDYQTLESLDVFYAKLRKMSFQYDLIAKSKRKKLMNMRKTKEKEERIASGILSYISHEINSPLHSIISYARMLIKDHKPRRSDENIQELLDGILTSSLYMLDLTSNILSSAFLEAEKPKLELEQVNIKDTLSKIRSSLALKSKAKEKALSFIEDIGYDSLNIVADRLKITQILYNLIDNAIKYTNSGEITVKVKKTNSGKSVLFAVKDTGIGIKYKDNSKLFKKYKRLASSEEKGAGLGLSIVKRLVKLHGGKVWVESRFTHGSTFYFTIPSIEWHFSSEREDEENKNISC